MAVEHRRFDEKACLLGRFSVDVIVLDGVRPIFERQQTLAIQLGPRIGVLSNDPVAAGLQRQSRQ